MNYIAEVNGFYNWIMLNELPSDAQALWHLLMNMNSRCAVKIDGAWYWTVEFTVSNSKLISILAFSRQQLDRMRNILIQTGRIVYKKSKGSKSGTYKMIPFDASETEVQLGDPPQWVWINKFVSHNVTQTVTQPVTQLDTQIGHNPGTYNKNKIKNNISCGGDGACDARARENAGGVDNFLGADSGIDGFLGMSEDGKRSVTAIAKRLVEGIWGRKMLETDVLEVCGKVWRGGRVSVPESELLTYAFEQAAKSGATTWRYVDGVFDRLTSRGLGSYADCVEYDAQRDFDRAKRNGLV